MRSLAVSAILCGLKTTHRRGAESAEKNAPAEKKTRTQRTGFYELSPYRRYF
jgi:hypothetical protein